MATTRLSNFFWQVVGRNPALLDDSMSRSSSLRRLGDLIQKIFQLFQFLSCIKKESRTSEVSHLLEESGLRQPPVYVKDFEPSSVFYGELSRCLQDPSQMSPDGALRYYARHGDVKGIIRAYKNGGAVNISGDGHEDENDEINSSGDYPLHLAVSGGYLKAVDQLLNMEADIEAKNRIHSTPLHQAVSRNFPDIVTRLVREGADVFALNKIGNTPLHCAAYGGFLEVSKILLDAGAGVCIEQENLVGMTPINYASRTSDELAKLLFHHHQLVKEGNSSEGLLTTARSSPSPETKKMNYYSKQQQQQHQNSKIALLRGSGRIRSASPSQTHPQQQQHQHQHRSPTPTSTNRSTQQQLQVPRSPHTTSRAISPSSFLPPRKMKREDGSLQHSPRSPVDRKEGNLLINGTYVSNTVTTQDDTDWMENNYLLFKSSDCSSSNGRSPSPTSLSRNSRDCRTESLQSCEPLLLCETF